MDYANQEPIVRKVLSYHLNVRPEATKMNPEKSAAKTVLKVIIATEIRRTTLEMIVQKAIIVL